LGRFCKRHFSFNADIVHAGCGSGQVDVDLNKIFSITALDISPNALSIYERVNKGNQQLILGDIFSMQFDRESKDGIYNLGVMEHFSQEEIQLILTEFHRVLKPNGKVLLFWPPEFGLSVIFLKCVHFVLNRILKKNIYLHPEEITRIKSKKHAYQILEGAKFEVVDYYFGPRDAFTYSVIAAVKRS
jgi:ubiquinone/menaquinone biosynthesis C-methylase UbiE